MSARVHNPDRCGSGPAGAVGSTGPAGAAGSAGPAGPVSLNGSHSHNCSARTYTHTTRALIVQNDDDLNCFSKDLDGTGTFFRMRAIVEVFCHFCKSRIPRASLFWIKRFVDESADDLTICCGCFAKIRAARSERSDILYSPHSPRYTIDYWTVGAGYSILNPGDPPTSWGVRWEDTIDWLLELDSRYENWDRNWWCRGCERWEPHHGYDTMPRRPYAPKPVGSERDSGSCAGCILSMLDEIDERRPVELVAEELEELTRKIRYLLEGLSGLGPVKRRKMLDHICDLKHKVKMLKRVWGAGKASKAGKAAKAGEAGVSNDGT